MHIKEYVCGRVKIIQLAKSLTIRMKNSEQKKEQIYIYNNIENKY